MCYGMRRTAAFVDESDHNALMYAGGLSLGRKRVKVLATCSWLLVATEQVPINTNFSLITTTSCCLLLQDLDWRGASVGRNRRSLLLQDLEDLDVVYSAGPSCAQGGNGRACAMGCDEPRSLWTSLTTTH